jgi:hypothetical protein
MDIERAKSLADNLVRRFELMDQQLPGHHSAALSFSRRMALLLSAEGGLPRRELQGLLSDGRTISKPDCALQEGLYAISSLLRSRSGHL